MDDQRFDRMTRALASGASRRRLVRGLAGGAAALLVGLRPGAAEAAPYSVPLGGACIRSHQCLQYFTSGPGYDPGRQAVACDFNGFAYDGEFNCCRYRGGFCSVDNDCCGYLSCFYGRYCDS